MGFNIQEFNYKKQNINNVVPHASPEVQLIIKKMLKVDPSKRPSAKQLLSNTLFKNALSMK
jgi:serine/threonine protein kinase